jgi:hypothetical protein
MRVIVGNAKRFCLFVEFAKDLVLARGGRDQSVRLPEEPEM